MNIPDGIICTKNGSLLEKYILRDFPFVGGSISTSIGLNPPRGTALIWDDRLKKNVWQESGLPSWEAGQEVLFPAMLNYLKKLQEVP